MNYDISNLATQAEDEMGFSQAESELKTYRDYLLDMEEYWFILVLQNEPSPKQAVYAARANYYGRIINNLDPIHY